MADIMTPQVITQLESYLRRVFGSQFLNVRARPKSADVADVFSRETQLGSITIDDEDGELTYQLGWSIKDKPQPLSVQELTRLQTYLRDVLGSKTLSVRARGKLKDSAEVFVGDDSLAILSVERNSYEFQMAILEMDLDDVQ
jgi:uncharacterized protein DUF3126